MAYRLSSTMQAQTGQCLGMQPFIIAAIRHHDAEQEIRVAGHQIAFHHLGRRSDRLFEGAMLDQNDTDDSAVVTSQWVPHVDVREEGEFSTQGHPLFATPLPLSRLEPRALALLPDLHTRIVLMDSGEEGQLGRAGRAAARPTRTPGAPKPTTTSSTTSASSPTCSTPSAARTARSPVTRCSPARTKT